MLPLSVSLYDDAILKKLQLWADNSSLTVLGVEDTRRLFETEADVHNDESIKLPLLSLKRKSSFTIDHTAKAPMADNGALVMASDEKGTRLNAVPITLSYQLDVYTRHKQEAEEYIRNLIFNMIDFPRITVEIPYEGLKWLHDANMIIESTVTDNSSDSMRLNLGQFTKLSIEFTVPDAYLWDVRTRTNKRIDLFGSGLLIYNDLKDENPIVEKLDINNN